MKTYLIATTALLGSTFGAYAEGQLNLFNWGNYTSPEMIAKFTEQTGIDVTITDYDSNTTALTKVEADASGFDLIVPLANYIPVYVRKGVLAATGSRKNPQYQQYRRRMEKCPLGSRPRTFRAMAMGLCRYRGKHLCL